MIILANPEAGEETAKWVKRLNEISPRVYARKIHGIGKFKKIVKKTASEDEKIVVMGGDGTINAAVQVLAQTNTDLGVIPTGMGNDFAKGLGIPLDPIKAYKLAKTGNSRKIGLGRVNDTYFCNSFGIGFDAKAIRFSKKYKREALKNILKFQSFPVKGELFSKEKIDLMKNVFMVTFANGETEGGGIRISKNGFENSKLGLTIVNKCSKLNRLFIFPLFFTNFFDLSSKVTYKEVDFARLEMLRAVRMHVDGEVYFPSNEPKVVEVQYCPKSLNVITH